MQKNEANQDREITHKSKCTHLRIRDDNDYNLNIEALINTIEKEFHIDFRSLPQWQNLVKRLHVSQTDYQRKIQNANLQKTLIIDKLFMQSTRPSPFELTDNLIRTASKWRKLKKRNTQYASELQPSTSSNFVEDEVKEKLEDEIPGEEMDTLHPNTVNSSLDQNNGQTPSRVDEGIQYSSELPKPPSNLPIIIYTNAHKLMSPLGSKTGSLSYHTIPDKIELTAEGEVKEQSTSAVICNPTIIRVAKNTLQEQSLLFSLTNCTLEYVHVRFKHATNDFPFKKLKILPAIPKRLYPGIAVVFKLLFKLQTQEDFETFLYFRIGRDVYTDAPTEPLFVPLIGAFTTHRTVTISETVAIPPIYPWHVKAGPNRAMSNYATGTIKICVDEPYSYHMHIHKRLVDLSKESATSMKLSPLDTESFEERDSLVQSTVLLQSKYSFKSEIATPLKNTVLTEIQKNNQIQKMNIKDIMSAIVDDIMQLVLDVFVFDRTYRYLYPHSRCTIPVYFVEMEHIGYHHCYYDVELIDPETETVLLTKTIKLFAEVLPHPIQITPLILDMTHSPVSYGYCEDRFIVTNTHKLYPVTVHVKLTTKMKRIFCVMPMKALVPKESSMAFEVKFCSRDDFSVIPSEDLVHFTIKIILLGYKEIYFNIPPIFYEIIAPCAMEFKKVYNEKYFKEIDD